MSGDGFISAHLLVYSYWVRWLWGKESDANVGDARDVGSIPGLRKSPGIGNSKPLQYSCLENSIDRGAWPQSMGLHSQIPLSVRAHTHTHTHNSVIY